MTTEARGLCTVCGREPMPPCPHQGVEAGSMRCLDCGRTVRNSDPVFKMILAPLNPCRRGHYANDAVWAAECHRLGYERERKEADALRAEVLRLTARVRQVESDLADALGEAEGQSAAHAEAIRVLTLERDELRRDFDAIGRSAEAIRAEEREAIAVFFEKLEAEPHTVTGFNFETEEEWTEVLHGVLFNGTAIASRIRALAPAAAPTPTGAPPGLSESLLASPCVCGHPLSQHVPRDGTLACTAKDCACGPGCIHEGFVLNVGASAVAPTGAPADESETQP